MNTSKKSSFDFPITQEDRPDTLLTDQMDHRRLDILGRRVTLITILIPILIILIGLLGYREIRGMISLSQDLGAKELTSMARNLESSLSNLSINHAKLESDIFARFDQLETTVNRFQENLQKMEASLDAVKTLKADKQALSDEINKVDTKFQPVLNDLKSENAKVAADVAGLNKKLVAEMEKISDQFNGITTAVAECQADLGLVSGEKADKKQLDITFKNQEKRIQDIADKMVHTMGEQIESMQARIKELERAKTVPEKPAAPQPPAQPAPKKAPAQP